MKRFSDYYKQKSIIWAFLSIGTMDKLSRVFYFLQYRKKQQLHFCNVSRNLIIVLHCFTTQWCYFVDVYYNPDNVQPRFELS